MLAGLLVAASALAQQAAAPKGWTIQHGEQAYACSAEGPSIKGASLEIAVIGQLFLVIDIDGYSPDKRIQSITLRSDGKPEIHMDAMVSGSSLGISVTPDISKYIEGASFITAVVGNSAFTFPVANVGTAMDATLRCAGMESRAGLLSHAPQPIANAGGWTLSDHVPPATNMCVVRLNGDQIDTSVSIGENRNVMLVGGKPNWVTPPGMIDITLQFDELPSRATKAGAINNIMIVTFSDPTDIQQLRKAHTIRWTYHGVTLEALVDGLDKAFDALQDCDQRKRAAAK